MQDDLLILIHIESIPCVALHPRDSHRFIILGKSIKKRHNGLFDVKLAATEIYNGRCAQSALYLPFVAAFVP